VDLIAVTKQTPRPEEVASVATALAHDRLPCPARQLELVVYDPGGLRACPPRFALNLNTGAGRDDHVGLDPDAEARHWFPIDLSIARAGGRALVGPPPEEALPEPDRATLLAALLESLDWHAANEPGSPGSLLNAYRAWRFTETGEWTTKEEARHAIETVRGAIPDRARKSLLQAMQAVRRG
jgi:hypothetical protein